MLLLLFLVHLYLEILYLPHLHCLPPLSSSPHLLHSYYSFVLFFVIFSIYHISLLPRLLLNSPLLLFVKSCSFSFSSYYFFYFFDFLFLLFLPLPRPIRPFLNLILIIFILFLPLFLPILRTGVQCIFLFPTISPLMPLFVLLFSW